MLNRQAFNNYLVSKRRNEKSVNESLKQFDKFQQFIDGSGLTSLADFSASHIFDHIRPNKPTNRAGAIKDANNFMTDYAASIEKNLHDDDNAKHVANVIRTYYKSSYEETAKAYAQMRLSKFLPLPDNFQVNPKILNGLTNSQFVAAFKDFHQLFKDIYSDIANGAPFDWGYPDFLTTEGYYSRVSDILFAFATCGCYENAQITVDAKKFFAHSNIKRHKKVELMINGFRKMGFNINGFDKKAEMFYVTYPENPHIIAVLHAYAIVDNRLGLQTWKLSTERNALSYRFIEDVAVQEYETVFHAIMDHQPAELLEIQQWLHAEATKCGFAIDPKSPEEKGMVLYKKGSKQFMLVGYKQGAEDKSAVWSKVIFRDVFETQKEKMEQLAQVFPDTFGQGRNAVCGFCDVKKKQAKPCYMRISYELSGETWHNCAYGSFWFKGVTIENIGGLLDLFKIENKIK